MSSSVLDVPDLFAPDLDLDCADSPWLDGLEFDGTAEGFEANPIPGFLSNSPFDSTISSDFKTGTSNQVRNQRGQFSKDLDRIAAKMQLPSPSPTSVLPLDSLKVSLQASISEVSSPHSSQLLPKTSQKSEPGAALPLDYAMGGHSASNAPATAQISSFPFDLVNRPGSPNLFNNLLGCTTQRGASDLSQGMGRHAANPSPFQTLESALALEHGSASPSEPLSQLAPAQSLPHSATEQPSPQAQQQKTVLSEQEQRMLLLLRYRQLSLLRDEQKRVQRAQQRHHAQQEVSGGLRENRSFGRSISLDPVPARRFQNLIPHTDPGRPFGRSISLTGLPPRRHWQQGLVEGGEGGRSQGEAGMKLPHAVCTPPTSPSHAKHDTAQQGQQPGQGRPESVAWAGGRSRPLQHDEAWGRLFATAAGVGKVEEEGEDEVAPLLRRSVTADGGTLAQHAACAAGHGVRTARSGGHANGPSDATAAPRQEKAKGKAKGNARQQRRQPPPKQSSPKGGKRTPSVRGEELEVENRELRADVKRLRVILGAWATQGFVTEDQALDYLAGRSPAELEHSSMQDTTLPLSR